MDFTLIARRQTDNFVANNLALMCVRNSAFVLILVLGHRNRRRRGLTFASADAKTNARYAQLHISEQAFHC